MVEKVKHLVRAGVSAESVSPTGRSTEELNLKIRNMVERGIVQLAEIAKREMISANDVDLLQRLHQLLAKLDAPASDDPSKLSDEELARRAK